MKKLTVCCLLTAGLIGQSHAQVTRQVWNGEADALDAVWNLTGMNWLDQTDEVTLWDELNGPH